MSFIKINPPEPGSGLLHDSPEIPCYLLFYFIEHRFSLGPDDDHDALAGSQTRASGETTIHVCGSFIFSSSLSDPHLLSVFLFFFRFLVFSSGLLALGKIRLQIDIHTSCQFTAIRYIPNITLR